MKSTDEFYGVISFSHKQTDTKSIANIKKLRKYGKQRGISFSYLMLQAINEFAAKIDDGTK